MQELSRVQQLHLDLLRTVAFNALDGAQVADDLLAHRDLWRACFIDRIGWAYPHITTYRTVYRLDHHLARLVAAATREPADRAALLAEGESCVRLLTDLRQTVGLPSRAFDLIRLRDLPGGFWNADTLFIRCSGVDDERLERLARDQWHGEVEIVPQDEASDRGEFIGGQVITVWWD
jgi:hypothetical protein